MMLATALTWNDWSIVHDFIVNFYLGSEVMFTLIIFLLIIGVMVSNGIPFKFAVVNSTPLIAGYAIGGWLMTYTWVLNLSLLVLGLIYSLTLSKLLT